VAQQPHAHHQPLLDRPACPLQSGVKYLLASRPDATPALLPLALPVLSAALADREDAVQAAAADGLVPVAPVLLAQDPEVGAAPRRGWDAWHVRQ
jgi:hypothetical protein